VASAPVVVGARGPLGSDRSEKVVSELIDKAPHQEAFSRLLNKAMSMSATPLYIDSHVELLVDGPATYAAMLDAIATATRFIHIETYIFADDKIGRRFANALIAKAGDGVDVRVIFDSLGSLSSTAAFFDDMRKAGIEVYEYHSVNPFNGGNDTESPIYHAYLQAIRLARERAYGGSRSHRFPSCTACIAFALRAAAEARHSHL
jgi:cardiolipin synthase